MSDACLPPAAGDDLSRIDALARAFYAAFRSGDDAAARIDTLHALCIAQAILVNNSGDAPAIQALRDFIAPRKRLLGGGVLQDFIESETAARTDIHGNVAQRLSLYRKTWRQDGARHDVRGIKTMQLLRTRDGWRFSAVAWDDARDGFTVPGHL